MGSFQTNQARVLIVLVTLALTALFLAQGTTRLIAAAALPLHAQGGAEPRANIPAFDAAPSTRRSKDPDPILRRNIFDSATGDLTRIRMDEIPADEGGPIEPTWDPNAPPPRCDGSARLVGAVVSPHRPEWSFASIVAGDGKSLLYRAGMQVDGKQLVGIQSHRVYLASASGPLCSLSMFKEDEAAMPAPAAPKVSAVQEAEAPAPRTDGALSESELDSGIRQVSETEFSIQRALVGKVLENQAEIMRSARILPHEENGRVVGVKLYGIRRTSLLGKLGLQNGDMLRTINGFDMTSPDTALEAYARLRSADNITVAVTRRGQTMNINYNIQ